MSTDEPRLPTGRERMPSRRELGVLAAGLLVAGAAGACSSHDTDYPDVDTAHLSAFQRRFVEITRAEWRSPRSGTEYSGGAQQEWCANFVSWTMRAAGQPLRNPNSGGWRIPGIYTLKEYYESVGRFARAGHAPTTGDVVVYGDGSPFGAHANMVVTVTGEQIWTVGGNEGGTVAVSLHTRSELTHVLGYGRPAHA